MAVGEWVEIGKAPRGSWAVCYFENKSCFGLTVQIGTNSHFVEVTEAGNNLLDLPEHHRIYLVPNCSILPKISSLKSGSGEAAPDNALFIAEDGPLLRFKNRSADWIDIKCGTKTNRALSSQWFEGWSVRQVADKKTECLLQVGRKAS